MRGVSPGESGVYVLQLAAETAAVGQKKVTEPGVFSAAAAVVSDVATARLWHRRFGHLGLENLAKLARHAMVEDLPVSATDFLARKSERHVTNQTGYMTLSTWLHLTP